MIKKRPVTPRETAAFTLFSMQEEGAWSDGALHYYLERASLRGRDAALATRLSYGVIQNQALCDFYLRRFSSVRLKKIAPRVLACLRLGIYQLVLMERIPAHAAVGETVTLIQNYAHADSRTVNFANGVLRAAARAVEENKLPKLDCPDKQSYFALAYSHPEWLVRELTAQFGEKEAGFLCKANNENVPLSLRVNRAKCTLEQAFTALQESGFAPVRQKGMDNILLCAGGDIAVHALFQSGALTVQDSASAVCVDVLNPAPGARVIDCCAAPGGKSFYIAEKVGYEGTVTACDIYEHKLTKIKEGAARLGLGNIETRLADAQKPQADLMESADAVLCDVPCSGMGIIRKKPEIRYKDEAAIRELPALQQAILSNASGYVKPGGVLVYSTCTVLRQENEAVVQAFLAAHPDFAPEPFTHKICGTQQTGMVTLLPHVHGTDGFFIAKLRRKA